MPTARAEAVPPHLGRSESHGPNHPIQGCRLAFLRDATTATGCLVHYDATRPHTRFQGLLFQAPWHSIRVGAAACDALSLATGTNTLCANSLVCPSSLCSSLVTRHKGLFAETHRMAFAPLPPLICPDPCSWLERKKKRREISPSPSMARRWTESTPCGPPSLDRPAVYAACSMQQTCTKGRLVGSRLALCVRRY